MVSLKIPILLLILVSSPIAYADCPDLIAITPESPSSSSPIVVTFCTNGLLISQGHTVTGNRVDVWIETKEFVFLTPPTQNLSETIPALPPGDYSFNVAYGDNQYSKTVSVFAPRAIPTLAPGSYLILLILLSVVVRINNRTTCSSSSGS